MDSGIWLINSTGERIALHTESGAGDEKLLEEYLEENGLTPEPEHDPVKVLSRALVAMFGDPLTDTREEELETFIPALEQSVLDRELVRDAVDEAYPDR